MIERESGWDLHTRAKELWNMGQIEQAIDCWKSARSLFERDGMKAEAAMCQMNIGAGALELGRPKEALSASASALAFYQKTGQEDAAAGCLMNLGGAFLFLGQPQNALNHLRLAAGAYLKSGSPRGIADSELNIANILCKIGQYRQAIAGFERAREQFGHLGLDEEAAKCTMNIGLALSECGDRPGAIAHFETAQLTYTKLHLQKESADCALNIGIVLSELDRSNEALPWIKQASDIYRMLKRDRDLARAETGMGGAQLHLGHLAEALDHFQRAHTIYESYALEEQLAASESNIATVLKEMAKPLEAIGHLKRAVTALNRLGLEDKVADCNFNIGNALSRLSNPREAVEYYEQAGEVYRRFGAKHKIAGYHAALGGAFDDLNRLQDSLEQHEQARELYRELGSDSAVAACDLNIGNVLADLGRFGDALDCYNRAITISDPLGFEATVALAERNAANQHRHLGQIDNAINRLNRAKSIYERLKRPKDIADCEKGMADVFWATSRQERALECYRSAKDVYTGLGLAKDIADCNVGIACALWASSNSGESISLIEAALQTYQSLKMDSAVADCNINLGNALQHIGTSNPSKRKELYSAALTRFVEAMHVFEEIRGHVSSHTHRVTYIAKYATAYREACICSLGLSRVLEGLTYLERSRSWSLAEAVATIVDADLETLDNDGYNRYRTLRKRLALCERTTNRNGEGTEAIECSRAQRELHSLLEDLSIRFPDTPFGRRWRAGSAHYMETPNEYSALLPNGRSCLLDFLTWADDDRLRVFLVTRQKGIEIVVFAPGSLTALKEVSETWRTLYSDRATILERAAAVDRTCEKLYQLIFDAEVEIQSDVATVNFKKVHFQDYLDTTLDNGGRDGPRHIFVIPHRFLFLLPLHAAYQKTGGRRHYLIESYVVSYAPSAHLLRLTLEREKKLEGPGRALLVGNPLPGPRPLPLAGREARDVGKHLRQVGWHTDELTEAMATKENFLSSLERASGRPDSAYNHLHLAQHATMVDQGRVHLEFGRDSSSANEEYLCGEGDIVAMPMERVESVVAATCLSMVTDPTMDEYLGLGAAFLQAGVQTYIGTLYPLSDLGSSLLIPELYRLRFKEHLNWADALRQAQLEMAGVALGRVGSNRSDSEMPDNSGENKGHFKAISKSVSAPILERISADHPYHWAAFALTGKP